MAGKLLTCLGSLTCIGLTLANPARACDCVSSELSHALAGALVAGASTAIADRYWPEHRAVIGFTVSAAAGVLGEAYQASTGGRFGVLDAASNAIGAGIGSLVTDKLILMPIMKREHASTHYGIMAGYAF